MGIVSEHVGLGHCRQLFIKSFRMALGWVNELVALEYAIAMLPSGNRSSTPAGMSLYAG